MELRIPKIPSSKRAAIVHEVGQHLLDAQTTLTFKEALHILALETRLAVGAHQCAISYVPLGDFHAGIHTHSFSEKYEKYNSYDVMPTGQGIWGLVVREKKAVRMTEQELYSHPLWKNFSGLKDARGLGHPPMIGWLAAPVLRPNGELLGVLQLSDKYENAEFVTEDIDQLIHLAAMVFPTFELHYVNAVNQQLQNLTEELKLSRNDLGLQVKALAEANESLQREVAEREKAEEARHKLEGQLLHSQKLESLGILAGGIAHDFNNLLTSILGNADLARQELPPDSPPGRLIGEAVKGARQAAELTNQMLAYSGKGHFSVQSINLSNLIEDMSRLLKISISKKCVMMYNFMPNLPNIVADPSQMHQLIMNCVINASEAIGDRSGQITVTTGIMHCDRAYLSETYIDENLPEGLYVYLEVADTGCGMSKETMEKMFDPFFTTKFTGRGLGLSVVLGIVRGHRGTIKVYSQKGQGTTFRILFPATTRPPSPKERLETGSKEWRGSGTILIVDDEESVRALASVMMKKMGFTVRTAADGQEAVEIFRREGEFIRLVLLDSTMPHLDGEETFNELRRIRGNVRAILSSGYNEQTATSRFAGKGLAAFLKKPYSFNEMMAMVRKVLESESEGKG